MGKKVEPRHTLDIIETIIEDRENFIPWKPFDDIMIMEIEGFETSLDNPYYRKAFIKRFNERLEFIASRESEKGGRDKLPPDAMASLQRVIDELA
jgi:phosphoenolpyruvate carboxykinase (ATP)